MDPWNQLRRHTDARIALGRTGGSLPTHERLAFQLAHARARDAVQAPFDSENFAARLNALSVHSAACDRPEYLRRPDLGRRLAPQSRTLLAAYASRSQPCDLVIILSDGLSTQALLTQCEPLLAALLPLIRESRWSLAPIIVARHARIALQDEIGVLLKATISLILLGERPGLGSPDSLGAYFIHTPAPGRTDADRNCISNIRSAGLPIPAAAAKLHYLLAKSFTLHLSGIPLKDDGPTLSSFPQPEGLSLPK